MTTKIIPMGQDEASFKLHEDISQMLMDYVCYNQKPFSKALTKFLIKGMHDLRAGIVAVEILARVQKYLDDEEAKK